MKKFLPSFLIALVLLTVGSNFVLADGASVNLTVKNNGDVVYSGSVTLLPVGTININDSSGNPHQTNADSVLSVVNSADALSTEFNISNLIYYDIFGAFYLKCVSVSQSELCDNWQYKVDGNSPDVGMDSKILSGGENVVLYFGDENKAPEPPPVHRNGGGGGLIALNLNAVSPAPPVSNPPVSTTPTSTLPVSAPTPTPINTTPEEKPKPALSTTSQKPTKKISKITKQKAVTIVNTTPSTPPITQTETPRPVKKGWFKNLLDKIFSIF